jgi:hypothetical protein
VHNPHPGNASFDLLDTGIWSLSMIALFLPPEAS